jgi:regulator of RNase E activity RraA
LVRYEGIDLVFDNHGKRGDVPVDRSAFPTPGTSAICDAMDRLQLHAGEIIGLSIAGCPSGRTIVGRARVAIISDDAEDGISGLAEFIDEAPTGSVLVSAFHGTKRAATFGELAATRARERGAVALVSDGWVRDVKGVVASGLTVVYKGATPLSGKGRLRLDRSLEPVIIFGVTVKDGDVVAIDEMGICVIPEGDWEEVAELATAIEQDDRSIREAIKNGSSFAAATTQLGTM